MDKIRMVEAKYRKKELPEFSIGDTVKVYIRIVEEEKQRLQAFEGVVIAMSGSSIRETFTVRRTSYGEGVERKFPLHSPAVDKVKVLRRGKVKRAKLYYLRKKIGKRGDVKEKIGGAPKPKEAPAS